MKYEGRFSADNSVFLGANKKLDIQILVFSGELGMAELELFRKDFLNLATNSAVLENLSASSVEATYVSYPLENIKTGSDLVQDFETNLSMQQKSIPKVSIEKSILYIGGQTGSTSLSIQGTVNAELLVKYIVTSLKLKDKSSAQFAELLLSSIDVPVATIVAFTIVNQLARTVMVGSVKHLHTLFIKEFEVGKVVSYAQVKNKATTSSGKYLIRSLSGIENKLKKQETSNEARRLFLEWLVIFYNDGNNKKDFEAFFSGMIEVISEKVASDPPKK